MRTRSRSSSRRLGLAPLPLGLLAALLLAPALSAAPAWAQPTHPFGGEVLDLAGEAAKVRAAPTLAARQQAAERFLQTLYRDPYLRALGGRMHLERWLADLAAGKDFDRARFRAEAAAAVAQHTELTADVGSAELKQKLEVLELAFTAPRAGPGAARAPPIDAAEVGRNPAAEILGTKDTRVLSMEAVPGAKVLYVSDRVALPDGASREAVALDLYGRYLVPTGSAGHGELRAGLAHREVGRAVLGPPRLHPSGSESADVLKGVGPTPYANNENRFNHKATGTFPLPEAVRDWERSEVLRRGGVAVYEPVAIVALPYAEWSESEGWRPVAVYVRRPRENLRVSDLDHLSRAQKRTLVGSLRGKIEAELRSAGRSEAISDADVIRHFVERVGRTAGLFQGGLGEGRYFFHGMLHDQNVSLMGEMVDIGNGEGFQKTRAEMREAWKTSAYAWWPKSLPKYRDLRGDVETAVFRKMITTYNESLASATGGGLSEAELSEIFAKSYREGRRGLSANDATTLLTVRASPQPAELDRFRRADGTLKWGELTRSRALSEGAGLGHFALALFLKEIAVVTATGDRARIEEFFDGLMTTDFYKHYGLFVAGARVGEVAYVRYLQRFVRPQFVNGLLKTNLVLAAGIALPLIVEGKFEGKAFAISVGALGLSSAAVKSGVSGIKWVLELGQAQRSGVLARFGSKAGRLAKVGGWFYTAAELAVVLYVADEVDARVNAYLDLEQARDELTSATQAFLAATRGASSEEALGAAADDYHQAWIAYRNHLYAPLHQDEAILAQRLEGAARRAKIKADEREAALTRLREHPALQESVVRRHGSLEDYAASLVERDEAAIRGEVDTYLQSHAKSRDQHLREVYESHARGEPLLEGVSDIAWHLGGGVSGASGDPYGARTDVFAGLGRFRARAGFSSALGSVSRNRLEAYDDEAALLAAAAAALRARGEGGLARLLDTRRQGTLELKAADQALIRGDGLIDTTRARVEREGISETLRKAGAGAR